MYQKKTLRRFTPEQRKIAIACNDIERTLNRLKKMVDTTGELEHDSRALKNSQRLDATRAKTKEDSHALDDWEKESQTAKLIAAGKRLGV